MIQSKKYQKIFTIIKHVTQMCAHILRVNVQNTFIILFDEGGNLAELSLTLRRYPVRK